jgi:hypothetical protein
LISTYLFLDVFLIMFFNQTYMIIYVVVFSGSCTVELCKKRLPSRSKSCNKSSSVETYWNESTSLPVHVLSQVPLAKHLPNG